MSNPFESPAYAEPAGAPRSMRLKRIGVLSVAVFFAAAGAVMGFVVGGFFSLLSLVAISRGAGAEAFGFGAGAIIMLPLFYGFGGFIAGAINAFVYNIIAGMTGGITVELSNSEF